METHVWYAVAMATGVACCAQDGLWYDIRVGREMRAECRAVVHQRPPCDACSVVFCRLCHAEAAPIHSSASLGVTDQPLPRARSMHHALSTSEAIYLLFLPSGSPTSTSRWSPSSVKSVSWTVPCQLVPQVQEASRRLTAPKLRVDSSSIDQLAMRPALRDSALLQHDDLVAVIDRSQSMRHKDARPGLVP